jgi:hypothetical protein
VVVSKACCPLRMCFIHILILVIPARRFFFFCAWRGSCNACLLLSNQSVDADVGGNSVLRYRSAYWAAKEPWISPDRDRFLRLETGDIVVATHELR